jgi:hypothetical protein
MQVAYEPSGASAEAYDPATMPTTFVIDGHGIVRHIHAGYRRGDERALAAKLDRLLANAK